MNAEVNGWQTVPLGDVAAIERSSIQPEDIKSGTTYIGLENIESGGVFVGAGSVDAGVLESSKFRFTDRHVLYGKLRPYLAKIACPDFSGICSTDILPILPGSKIDRRYLLHFLRQPSMVEYAASQSVGVNLPRLSPSVLERFPVPLPCLGEQRQIAAILDKADELRARRRAARLAHGSLCKSVFLDFFGHPQQNPKQFPSEPLGDLCTRVTVGFVGPMADQYVRSGVPLLRSLNVRRGRLSFEDLKFISPEFNSRLSKSALRAGDVVSVRTGQPGTTAVVPASLEANCADLIVMTCGPRLNPHYLAEMLNIWLGDAKSIQGQVGAIQIHFNIGAAKTLRIPVAPIEQQRKFAQLVARAERFQVAQERSLTELDALFASLQQRAFRGEL